MAAAGKDVGIVRAQQIDVFDRLVSHLMNSIFFSAYFIIISRLSHVENDRQVISHKIHSSRDSRTIVHGPGDP
jgi:hypothetical protein